METVVSFHIPELSWVVSTCELCVQISSIGSRLQGINLLVLGNIANAIRVLDYLHWPPAPFSWRHGSPICFFR